MNHRFLQLEEKLTSLRNGSRLESHLLYPGMELFFLTLRHMISIPISCGVFSVLIIMTLTHQRKQKITKKILMYLTGNMTPTLTKL